MESGKWHLVQRRRSRPVAPQITHDTATPTNTLLTYASRPSFAQIVQNPPTTLTASRHPVPSSVSQVVVQTRRQTTFQAPCQRVSTRQAPVPRQPRMARQVPPTSQAKANSRAPVNQQVLATSQAPANRQTQPAVPANHQPTRCQVSRHATDTVSARQRTTQNKVHDGNPTFSFLVPPSEITLPESPTRLRYPPSPTYEEWHVRCFRCFHRGHLKAECTNARRCVFCWGNGHFYAECPVEARRMKGKGLVDEPVNTNLSKKDSQLPTQNFISDTDKEEPDYLELLDGNNPNLREVMPHDSERPEKVCCHISRDDAHFDEVSRLKRGIVITTRPDLDLSADFIAEQVASTNLVKASDLQIATLTNGRHFVLPPEGVFGREIGMAFPESWWELGYKVEQWSPLIDAEVERAMFKVWIILVGIPPHLWREEYVIQAVGEFATFLGSITNSDPNDMSVWSVAAATPDLRRIPRHVFMTADEKVYPVKVMVRRWVTIPILDSRTPSLPPPSITRPSHREALIPSPSSSSDEAECQINGDCVTLKVSGIRQIFRNVDPSLLPPSFTSLLTDAPSEQPTKSATAGIDIVTLRRQDLTPVDNPRTNPSACATKNPTTAATQKSSQKLQLSTQRAAKRLSSIDVMELHASVRENDTPLQDKRLAFCHEDAAAEVPSPVRYGGPSKRLSNAWAGSGEEDDGPSTILDLPVSQIPADRVDIPGSDEELVDYSE